MKRIFTIAVFVCAMLCARAEWQWRVPVTDYVSDETNANPDAFLWVPERCDSVKAVIFAFQNMNEETIFEMESFRDRLADMDVAMVWIAPGFGQEWDVKTGVQQAFDKALADLAEVSGYSEIATAPLIPLGHSAQATMPWNFAAWNPERTLCVISYHGDAPRTNLCGYGRENVEWGRNRSIDGIPGLMIEGEYEWWDARVRPALAFKMKYPRSCVSFLGDAGRGHFDVAERTADYIAKFIEKSLAARQNMKKVDPEDGWLAEQWAPAQTKRAKAAPWAKYKGNRHEAFWYFDEEMVKLTEARYAETCGKQPMTINFEQDGQLLEYDENLHVRTRAKFEPEADGITYHIKAVFVDTTHNAYAEKHPAILPTVKRICGPVKVVNDTTFKVDFYRMGMNNPRRTWDMVLCAEAPGDATFKESVQQIEIKLPFRNTGGLRQAILFPSIQDVKAGVDGIELKAVSDQGLPVSYYVKEGPAEVEGDRLVLTQIPPRTKYPVKVTVVAWQYGLKDKVQTAEPVERTFFIRR